MFETKVVEKVKTQVFIEYYTPVDALIVYRILV